MTKTITPAHHDLADAVSRQPAGERSVDQGMLGPRPSVADVRSRILDALHRHADLVARHIRVEAEGSRIILSGNVRSPRERYDAVEAAWSAPGVASVDNRIDLIP